MGIRYIELETKKKTTLAVNINNRSVPENTKSTKSTKKVKTTKK